MDIFNRIWRFFTSVKLTVVLLLSLAGTSIIGTLIPQNQSPAAYFRAFGEYFYRFFDLLNIFDMYHSWWFQMLVTLLAVNILVCSIDRLSANRRIIFNRNPSFKKGRFQKQAEQNAFSLARAPSALIHPFEQAVARRFRRVRTEQTEDGFFIFAEKWRLSRLGVYIVHSSVILLLVGGLIGSIFGFDGYVNIPEGESVDRIRLRNTGAAMPLPYAIRCNNFDVTFYPSGQPKEFRSDLSLIKDGKVVYEKDIIVNDPIRYDGINIFQSSYGRLAPEKPAAPVAPTGKIRLELSSVETGMVYHRTVKMGETVELPEESGTFVLKEFLPGAGFMGRDIGAALLGLLTPAGGGEPVKVLLPLKFPNFDKMRRGALVISAVPSHAEGVGPKAENPAEPRYFTGLQVTKDPGIGLVYTGFVLMIAGCFITFFMSHQQLYIEVTPEGRGSYVRIGGVADRNRMAMESRVKQIAKSLAGGGL